jgi:hypothetical protein
MLFLAKPFFLLNLGETIWPAEYKSIYKINSIFKLYNLILATSLFNLRSIFSLQQSKNLNEDRPIIGEFLDPEGWKL